MVAPERRTASDQVFIHGLQIGYNPAVAIKQLDYQMLAHPSVKLSSKNDSA